HADDGRTAQDAAVRQRRGGGRGRGPGGGLRPRRRHLLAVVVAVHHAGGEVAAGTLVQAAHVLTDDAATAHRGDAPAPVEQERVRAGGDRLRRPALRSLRAAARALLLRAVLRRFQRRLPG